MWPANTVLAAHETQAGSNSASVNQLSQVLLPAKDLSQDTENPAMPSNQQKDFFFQMST